ncbi:MAG: hypothetical protein OCC49_09635 [Fibrobacterales bacterium]
MDANSIRYSVTWSPETPASLTSIGLRPTLSTAMIMSNGYDRYSAHFNTTLERYKENYLPG